ncbi:MAG TPA: hypothetical protein VK836_08310 [Streptosporangiaceae bacterium]|nr:hypothetical protein [Streptosporangiaceae bacterium]
MRRSAVWIVLAVVVGIAVVSCGISGAAPQGAGHAASVSLSLTTVPTIRSVTVSPAKAAFGTCSGGLASRNTLSTAGKLGFPNGRCFVGLASPGIYPITITNTGIASDIYVNGTSANPADNGDQWVLCGQGHDGTVACTGRDGRPGTDQYRVETFSPAGERAAGLGTTPRCDNEFDAAHGCWAVEGASQSEGIELVGPSVSSDTSTKWTMTITWTPVPSQG